MALTCQNGRLYFAATVALFCRDSGSASPRFPVKLENPLLIIVRNPLDELDATGFLLPALINGNFLYRGFDDLSHLLEKSHLADYVIGIDNASVLFLQNAQNIRSEAYLGSLGVVLSLIALGTSLLQSAMTWSHKRRIEIFLAITNGYRAMKIGLFPALADSLLAIVITGISFLVFVSSGGGLDASLLISSLSLFIVFYLIASVIVYTWQARSAFKLTVERNY